MLKDVDSLRTVGEKPQGLVGKPSYGLWSISRSREIACWQFWGAEEDLSRNPSSADGAVLSGAEDAIMDEARTSS